MGYTQLLGRYAATESDASARTVGEEGERRVNVDVDEDGAQLDGETLPENDLMEASEESEVVDEADADVDELLDTSAALESFLASASVARKQGGWTTQEAAAYGLGLDVVLGRIGAKASDAMPAVESFSSSRERQNSTAAVENRVTEILKSIWEAIKNSVNKVIVFVRRWYLKIADGATRLKKRAEAIRKKAENTTGSKKEGKIRGPLAGLHIDKNMPSASDLKKHTDKMATLIDDLTKGKMAKGYETTIDNLVNGLEQLVDKGKLPSDLKTLIPESLTTSALSADKGVVAKFPGAPTGSTGLSTGPLPGGKKFAALDVSAAITGSTESDAKGVNVAARFIGKIVQVDASDRKVEIDSSKEVTVLAPSEVVSLADAVVDLCDKVINYKKEFENYERKTKEALSKVDKIANGGQKGDDDKESDRLAIVRALANVTGACIRNQGTSTTTVISYAMGLGRNVLVYGNSSLGQYKD